MKNIIRVFIIILFFFGPTVTNVSAAFKFPWANTVTWQWWTRSPSPTWHDNCVTKCAMDLGTSGNYLEVVAIDNGTISSVCTSTNTADVYINHGGSIFGYFHIDKSTLESNISATNTVVQGQLIGKVRLGNFNEATTCSYSVSAVQAGTSGHLHFQVPIPATHTFDGWSITYPNLYMTSGGTTKYAGDSFTSTNVLIIKDTTINTTKTYTSKNEIIIKDQTIIDGTSATIIIKPI